MNKNVFLIVGLVGILGVGYFLVSSQNAKKMEMEKNMMEVKVQMEEKALMEKKAMEEKTMMEQKVMDEKMMTDDGTMKKDEAVTDVDAGVMMKKDASKMEKPVVAMTAKGSYQVYSPDKLALADKGDVVLFFRASWCPFCKIVDADIRANRDAIQDGLTILEVDYDNSATLKQKYGVTYQHTFVQVDSNGNQIAKWSGSETLAALQAQVR
jgi:thiol-disulfide isomerase/thioredoxin